MLACVVSSMEILTLPFMMGWLCRKPSQQLLKQAIILCGYTFRINLYKKKQCPIGDVIQAAIQINIQVGAILEKLIVVRILDHE